MTMAGHTHGMKSGGVQTSVCVPVRPGGTADISPPIYRWDTGIFTSIRPGGTFDIHPGIDPWEIPPD